MSELDLSLEPAKPKKPRINPEDRPPQPNYSWARYTSANRRFCDVCLSGVDKRTGPTKVINRAWWTEDGPEGRKWLCHPCHEGRKVLAES